VNIFENTLFYHQYRSKKYLRNELEKIVEELWEWEMVSREDSFLAPTLLGRTITATYLDPLSAHRFLESIKPGEKPGILYLLHLITYTPDYLRSKPYINYRIVDAFEEKAWDDVYDKLIPPPPDSDVEYGFWLQAYVHARLLYDWINEASEDSISEKYEVGPGDLYSAKETAAWISAGLSRISGVRGLEYYREELRKLSIRLEFGVKEDALELIRLEGIGRVRARILLKAGIRSLEQLAATPRARLVSLPSFGPKLVDSIKEQLARMGYSVVD